MKLILIPLVPLMLAGCVTNGSKPDCVPEIVVQRETVKVKVPESMTVIPPYGAKLDPANASQKDAAAWVVETEGRMYQLERQLEAIKKFNDDEPAIEVTTDKPVDPVKDGKPTE